MDYKRVSVVLFLFVFLLVELRAQFPQIEIPQPATLNSHNGIGEMRTPDPTPRIPHLNSHQSQTQRQNQQIMEEVREHERMRMMEQQALMNEYASRYVPLPNFQNEPGTSSFFSAYEELWEMLTDKKPLSLKRAVFVSENAWFNNGLDYNAFEKEIQNLKKICLLKMTEENLNMNDNVAKIMMIFRVMTTEVTVKEPGEESEITHYPMKYDFEDYGGVENRSQIFVTKLLSKNTGQCHSLPLLFLILAEELNAEAYLAFSPEHMYVKFQDKKGKWHNIELTRGTLVSDNFYMSSGFVKAEALRNKVYMSPLSKKETVAQVLAETAHSYAHKYGYDAFVRDCLETSLEHYPNNLYAHSIYSNYHTVQALHVIRTLGSPHPDILHWYPQAHELWNRTLRYYEKVDSLGYEKMPEHVYQNWLQQVDREKDNPENQPSMFKQIKR